MNEKNWNKCPNCNEELEYDDCSEDGGNGMPGSVICPKCEWTPEEE